MCLAVPGKVVATEDRDGTRMAQVDFGGVVKEVCLAYVPEAEVGEYVIVHVGFALQRLDEESARQSLELFEQLGLLEEEFGDAWGRAAEEAGAERPDTPGQGSADPTTAAAAPAAATAATAATAAAQEGTR
ncbi:HypC/HybG/HupF family hydrogenase formation chaperone [Streptomyces sp. NPDC051776]|uniref:HypC/HybG/HupF family hydrogenase formation chaperone n=1 Tax=Streptomyces sp. NPDC051776 TaxID=3155414 RepID=UPI00342EA31A